jgi:hypothetical protein
MEFRFEKFKSKQFSLTCVIRSIKVITMTTFAPIIDCDPYFLPDRRMKV